MFSYFKKFAPVKVALRSHVWSAIFYVVAILSPTFLSMPKKTLQVGTVKDILCFGTVTAAETINVLNPLNLLQCSLPSPGSTVSMKQDIGI